MELGTPRLRLVLQTRAEIERMIDAMPEHQRAQVSPDWLARMRAATAPDPWTFAFRILRLDSGEVVGSCAFKGRPVEGAVEISYAIDVQHQHNGYATEAAQALVEYAATRPEVRLVTAHTLPGAGPSTRVLGRCGFRYVGETVDAEDGTVSRYEKPVRASAGGA
jgi:[ribosomal protein S5]-alanine N-acetyltransferase